MTANGFSRSLPRVLQHEGGYVNDPHDPGGATNKGITFRVYDAYRTRKGLPTQDVRNITSEEISDIYRFQYWDACHCDDLPAGLDYVMFDGAVNSGPTQSIKWLQRAIGTLAVDGQIGQATLAAVADYGNPTRLVDIVCDRRLAFLQALKTWPRYKGGWSARVASVRKVGKAWSVGAGSAVLEPVEPTRKGMISDAKPLPDRGGADAATGGGVVTGGIGGVLETGRQQLEPLAEMIPAIGKIVAVLIVLGVMLTAGGMIYRWYAARKARELSDALDLPTGVAA